MTDTTITDAPLADPVGQGHDEVHHGLSDKGYIRVAAILALVTAAEVIWSYLPTWDDAHGLKSVLEVGGLIIMMVFKFGYVALNFMHLKFDDKILTRLFYAGLVLAVFVYLAALTTFQVWGSQNLGYK